MRFVKIRLLPRTASAGVYEFTLRSDGREIGTLPVEVVQAPARVVH